MGWIPDIEWDWEFSSGDTIPEIQIEVMSVFYCVSSYLSLLGSAFIIISANHPHLRSRFHRFLQFMSIADMFCSVSYLIGEYRVHSTCIAQAIGVHFFSVSSMLWTSVIAAYLHLLVRTRKKHSLSMLEPFCHIICWGYPVINTAVPLGLHDFNFRQPWCQLYQKYWFWRIFLLYVPQIVTLLFISVNYLGIFIKLRMVILELIFPWGFRKSVNTDYTQLPTEELNDDEENPIEEIEEEASSGGRKVELLNLLKLRARYSLYLVVCLTCWTPTVISNILELITGRHFYILHIMLAIFQPAQGFGNFLVYLLNPEVRGVCVDILLLRDFRGKSRKNKMRITMDFSEDDTIALSEIVVKSAKTNRVSLGAGLDKTFGVMKIDENSDSEHLSEEEPAEIASSLPKDVE